MRILAGLISALLLVPYADAGCFSTYCRGKGDAVVKSVFPNSTGNIYLEGASDKAALNCTLVEGQYMVLKSDHALFDEIYSTILTALVANREFQVRIVTGSADCEVSYVRMWN